jgi:hypothetical protein
LPLRAIFVFCLALGLCLDVRAASLTQIGANGTPGAPGLDSPPAPSGTNGGVGTAGASASADTSEVGGTADVSNDATATGGNGGSGGSGGTSASGAVGSGGDGGNGGRGTAGALTVTPADSAFAQSVATGGSGGDGGLPGASNGTYSGDPGNGGSGGSALAGSGVSNDGGTARATATAIGGASGTSLRPALGGSATAEAIASGLGDTTAEALAVGGSSFSSIPFNLSGAAAAAHAMATSASGNAFATAEARGGRWRGPSGNTPDGTTAGSGTPSAQAFAPNGDATAIARANIGELGIIALTDAVSGGASGKLTLIQEAIADESLTGAARSSLSAVNAYGGALLAESIASGNPARGVATASVVAQSHSDAPVEAHALATGRMPVADAHISANAGADLVATSRTTAINSEDQHSTSGIGFFGGPDHLASAARVDKAHSPFVVPDERSSALDTAASANRAAPQVDLSAVEARSARADVFLRSSPSDVAAWVAGNPEVQANLDAGGEILGLGSVALRGDTTAALSYTGSLSLSLIVTEKDFRGMTVAFLDPTAVGSIDTMSIAFRKDGLLRFTESFASSADVLAGLDDQIVPVLAFYGRGSQGTVELSFQVSFLAGTVAPALAFDLAFLSSAVPEPAPAPLALAGLTLALLRLVRRSPRSSRLVPMSRAAESA